MRTRLLNMTWSNLRFSVGRPFVTMAANLPSCFIIQVLEKLLKFLVNFTLLKYVKSQRSYGFLITKELIFGFQILDLKDHFSASLNSVGRMCNVSGQTEKSTRCLIKCKMHNKKEFKKNLKCQ